MSITNFYNNNSPSQGEQTGCSRPQAKIIQHLCLAHKIAEEIDKEWPAVRVVYRQEFTKFQLKSREKSRKGSELQGEKWLRVYSFLEDSKDTCLRNFDYACKNEEKAFQTYVRFRESANSTESDLEHTKREFFRAKAKCELAKEAWEKACDRLAYFLNK